MPPVLRPWLFLAVALVARAADSVVLVSAPTRYDEGWAKVVAALETAHAAKVLVFRASPAEQQEELRRLQPRFVTWVARPEELGPKAAVVMHRLARENDGDPYEDFQWGVVTGLDAAQALKLAAPGQPLVIRTVGAGTSFAMECVEQGYWFSEFKAGESWEKAAGGAPREVPGAKDSTASIVAKLNEGRTDLFITSGHATEHDWQPGYRYRNGTFGHKDGVILGKALDGAVHRLASANPKVYLPIGNCLMGNVPGGDCMALSWMASGGVRQMVGYVQPTWFGYAGWGVLDYFLEQPGRFNLSQAWLANHHALLWRLQEVAAGRAPAGDRRGLEFDRDMTILYGDPHWDARLAPGPLRWTETLTTLPSGEVEWVVAPTAGQRTFVPVDTNGSQRGGRPLVAFLPRHAAGWEVVAGPAQVVAADDFVLLPHPGPDAPVPARLVVRLRRR
jgi:zinc protease